MSKQQTKQLSVKGAFKSKRNAMPCFVLASLLLLMASPLMASTSGSILSALSAGAGDLTMHYLELIFGTVEGVFVTSSSSLLGHMFKFFNWGILTIAGTFMFYSIGMSIVNTANEGSFMGEKAKGFARTTRGVVGVGMLVPFAGGYSLIQVIVLWVVVQGIGLADYAWSTTIDYLQAGGSVAAAPTGSSPMNRNTMSVLQGSPSLALKVLMSEVCMEKLRTLVPTDQEIRMYSSSASDQVTFGSKSTANGGNFPGFCGRYTLPYFTTTTTDAVGVQTTNPNPDYTYSLAAFEALASALVGPARTYMDATGTPNETESVVRVATSGLIFGAQNYANLISPALVSANSSLSNSIQAQFGESVTQGWAAAGAYYLRLVNLNQQANYGDLTLPTSSFSGPSDSPHLTSTQNAQLGAAVQTVTAGVTTGSGTGALTDFDLTNLCGATSGMTLGTCAVHSLNTVFAQSNAMGGGGTGFSTSNLEKFGAGAGAAMVAAGGPTGLVTMAIVVGVVGNLLQEWSNGLSGAAFNDPILTVSKLGNHMVDAGVTIWITSTIAIFLLSILLSINSSDTGMTSALTASNSFFYSMVLSIVTALVVNGVVFATFIPLIPFMVYLFAVLGWLMSVVEAVVAAPLVALGVTHPEGHDLLGKAEQSVMLLLSVMLRPICIVIGFVAATLMVKIALRALNVGLAQIVNAIPNTSNIATGGFFFQWGTMVIYTLVMIRLVYFCYALITYVPDKVMKWIGLAGGSSYGAGAEGQIQEIGGGVKEGMQSGMKVATAVSESALKAASWHYGEDEKKGFEDAAKEKEEKGGGKGKDGKLSWKQKVGGRAGFAKSGALAKGGGGAPEGWGHAMGKAATQDGTNKLGKAVGGQYRREAAQEKQKKMDAAVKYFGSDKKLAAYMKEHGAGGGAAGGGAATPPAARPPMPMRAPPPKPPSPPSPGGGAEAPRKPAVRPKRPFPPPKPARPP